MAEHGAVVTAEEGRLVATTTWAYDGTMPVEVAGEALTHWVPFQCIPVVLVDDTS